jgi:hypothetical protein
VDASLTAEAAAARTSIVARIRSRPRLWI